MMAWEPEREFFGGGRLAICRPRRRQVQGSPYGVGNKRVIRYVPPCASRNGTPPIFFKRPPTARRG